MKKAQIINIVDLAPQVKEFTLKTASPFELIPGQFINIKINDDKPGMCFRAYSIAFFSKDKNEFKLVIKGIKDGRGSSYFFELKSGDSIEFLGPMGTFNLKNENKNLGLICTGTGITPFITYLEHLSSISFKGEITLLWGLSYEEDVYYINVLDQFKKKLANFNYYICISRSELTNLKSLIGGRVTANLRLIKELNECDIYICGNGKMVSDCQSLLIEKNIKTDSIFIEKFN